MQIFEKYRNAYLHGLKQIQAERARFQSELSKIKGFRVIPSQANYVMVELTEGTDSKEFVKRLLMRHNLLVKDLSGKTNGKNYLRLAIRNTINNDALLEVLRKELN